MSKLVRSNLLVSCFVYEWDGLVTISVQEAALLEHSRSQRNYGGCLTEYEKLLWQPLLKCIIMHLFSCILTAIVAQVIKSCTRLWICPKYESFLQIQKKETKRRGHFGWMGQQTNFSIERFLQGWVDVHILSKDPTYHSLCRVEFTLEVIMWTKKQIST